jgi:NAD(P)-dependent dehydrogenase (short-subunit alcohol dehydrogenase family)
MLRTMDANGTSAIVSGGASGLGEATARMLAAAGAAVVVADLNEDRGKQVADEIGGVFARTDVADEASVQAAVDVAVATGAPLRVAISCAGIGWAARTVGRDGTPHDLASYQKVIAVNLVGTFNLMRIGAAAMARTQPADSDGQRGVVVNTSSVAGIEGQTGQVAYSASKGGIIGMTVPAARDLAAIGVRVNTICPGIIDTPIYGFHEGAEEFKARLVAPVLFPKRMGRADEFAHLVRALIENDYMNAEVLRFDGGIRFQPKLRPATSGCYLTCGNALSAAFLARLGRHRAVRCRAEGRREYRLDLPQRRLVIVGHEVPVDVERERSAVVAKPFLDALDVRPAAQQQRGEMVPELMHPGAALDLGPVRYPGPPPRRHPDLRVERCPVARAALIPGEDERERPRPAVR